MDCVRCTYVQIIFRLKLDGKTDDVSDAVLG